MKTIKAYFSIIRPINAFLAAIGVALGFWLTTLTASISSLLLLITAAVCALGYGNVINDIKDAEGDKINHPQRPIPRGIIPPAHATLYAVSLAIVSIISSAMVSYIHIIATLTPLLLLTVYTLFLKATPLVGNILVSVLVAYTLIFGGLGSTDAYILIIPALLAFLLNLSREIIKDIQDREGDLKTGIQTTAVLPQTVITAIMTGIFIAYLFLLFLPVILDHFHLLYLLICAVIVLPLHLRWFASLIRNGYTGNIKTISRAIKLEMLFGLAALAIDTLFPVPLHFH